MNKEQIIEMAKQSRMSYAIYFSGEKQLQHFAKLIRNAALDEAIAKCEYMAVNEYNFTPEQMGNLIRGMKEE